MMHHVDGPDALRLILPFLLFLSLFFWKCTREVEPVTERKAVTLRELSVVVRDGVRSFFLSDKRGGFLVGDVGKGGAGKLTWSVLGEPVLNGYEISIDGKPLNPSSFDSAAVAPDCVVQDYQGGTRVEIAPLEQVDQEVWGWAILITREGKGMITARWNMSPDVLSADAREGRMIWKVKKHRATVIAYGGPSAEVEEGAMVVRGGDSLRIVLLLSRKPTVASWVSEVHRSVDRCWRERRTRMERLLERSYLRTSDETFTRAVAWVKLSLDALLVEGRDTLAAASLPWNGSFDGRANLQALSGLALVTGEHETAASILRTWAETQDRVSTHRTYGRIARLLHASPPVYDGIDVGGWFVRGVYDYLLATDDTSEALDLYPVIRRGIDGMNEFNGDRRNLIWHQANETWMRADRFQEGRGRYAAVEVQTLWQYQQIIGSYVALLAGDSLTAGKWAKAGSETSIHFAESFIDSSRKIVYDYLNGQGRGVDAVRPNALLALDAIDGELIQQALIQRTVDHLLYPTGPGTLGEGEEGFNPDPRTTQPTNGAIATWLTGAFVYAITRYDRQDLAYEVSRNLARQVLENGMVGALPAFLSAEGSDSIGGKEGGAEASLPGMAEFVRSAYQDYLGVRVDVPSSVIRFDPKLPPGVPDAEFTVTMGSHPVSGSYHREGEASRMMLSLSRYPRPVKWHFVWPFDGGDAWVGSIRVEPGTTVTIVASPKGILAYEGEHEVRLDEKWFIRGFARSRELAALHLAAPPR